MIVIDRVIDGQYVGYVDERFDCRRAHRIAQLCARVMEIVPVEKASRLLGLIDRLARAMVRPDVRHVWSDQEVGLESCRTAYLTFRDRFGSERADRIGRPS